MFQTFETNRLILKPRTLDDLEYCVEMDTDPRVTQYIPGAWNGSRKHIAFLKERISRSYPRGMGYWSIFRKDTPTDCLGWIHLLPMLEEEQTTEIGWRLKHSAWGKGYATEAAQAILKHAFATVNSKRVMANTHANNNRSKKVIEKLGLKFTTDFIYDGTIPSSSYEITFNTRDQKIGNSK